MVVAPCMIVAPMRNLFVVLLLHSAYAFQVSHVARIQQIKNVAQRSPRLASYARGENKQDTTKEAGGDNKAMQFLKKIGKVGESSNRDFRYAIRVDEGPAGKCSGSGLNVSRIEGTTKNR